MHRFSKMFTVGAVASFIMVTTAITAFADGTWSKAAPFPEPAEEVLGSSANGKIYVFAGLIPHWKPKGLVYEFNPVDDTWTKKKQMALPSHHVAFTQLGGKIYAFGGFVLPKVGQPSWVPINNAWRYDPTDDTWTALAPMPTSRGAAAAAAANGKIYVVGGVVTPSGSNVTAVSPDQPHSSVGTLEEYDPISDTWKELRPMPTARNHLLLGAVDGKLYAIGGRLSSAFIGLASDTSVVEEYDPAKDLWRVRARMPTERSSLAGGVVNGKIYVAGGEFQDARMSATFRAFESYDPAKNAWTTLPSMAVARHGMAGGVVGDTLHFVSGDVQSSGTGLDVSSPSHDVFTVDH